MKTLRRALVIVTIAGILGFGLYSVMQYTGVAAPVTAPVAANAGKPSALAGTGAPADAAARGG